MCLTAQAHCKLESSQNRAQRKLNQTIFTAHVKFGI